MIISREHNFIFLKTEKTASSTLEKYLRSTIRDRELLVPATPKNKQLIIRSHGTLAESSFCGGLGGASRILPNFLGLHGHARAEDIRKFLGADLFDSYKIITSERNPWDRQLSLFWHRSSKRGRAVTPESFNAAMHSTLYNLRHYNRLRNWEIYSIDGRPCAHKVIRFENLKEDLKEIATALGLEFGDGIPHERGQYGRLGADYKYFYQDSTRDLIYDWYRNEIDHFGYKF